MAGLDAGSRAGNKHAMDADALFEEAAAALRASRTAAALDLFGRAGRPAGTMRR